MHLPLRPLKPMAGMLMAGLLVFCCSTLFSQQGTTPVTIKVDTAKIEGPLRPAWNNFGYDEPNATYTPNGKKLLGELAAMSPVPVYIRTHNLLTTGDGAYSLKWGSTNAYTEDAHGNPVYNWTIMDRIFDAYHAAGVRPLVEVGFMPEALSTHPKPYRHNFPHGAIFTGWSYPPNNYKKWAALVYAWAAHERQRYGDAAVNTWRWEVWNEPDIGYWHGTPQEYLKLYDYTTAAIRRAIPNARVGGPEVTNPANPRAASFLRLFLDHCAHGRNYATGKTGAPLDFITYHPKGASRVVDGHIQMDLAAQLKPVQQGFSIIASYPEWKHTPILFTEFDPEGCAACTARTHPENGYRHSPQYGTYIAAGLQSAKELARQYGVNFEGAVTWAFEFEDQPWFAGYRALATHGVDKPVMNAFRMFGLMHGSQIEAVSSASITADQILQHGVKTKDDVDVVASRSGNEVDVLVWNYNDNDSPAPAAPIDLAVAGIPKEAQKVLIAHYRVDQNHSDSFTAWRRMGSPQQPTAEQYKQLEKAGQLQLLGSPCWTHSDQDGLHVRFTLPKQALSLLRITW